MTVPAVKITLFHQSLNQFRLFLDKSVRLAVLGHHGHILVAKSYTRCRAFQQLVIVRHPCVDIAKVNSPDQG